MSRPELDASAYDLDLRMSEGDPINFQWVAEGAAAWAGAHTCSVTVGDVVVPLACTVSVYNTTDALFAVVDGAQAALVATQSGYPWRIKADAGPTRFAGLLRVEAQL